MKRTLIAVAGVLTVSACNAGSSNDGGSEAGLNEAVDSNVSLEEAYNISNEIMEDRIDNMGAMEGQTMPSPASPPARVSPGDWNRPKPKPEPKKP